MTDGSLISEWPRIIRKTWQQGSAVVLRKLGETYVQYNDTFLQQAPRLHITSRMQTPLALAVLVNSASDLPHRDLEPSSTCNRAANRYVRMRWLTTAAREYSTGKCISSQCQSLFSNIPRAGYLHGDMVAHGIPFDWSLILGRMITIDTSTA